MKCCFYVSLLLAKVFIILYSGKPQPTAGHDQRKEHETQAATTTSKASDEGTSKVTKSFELLSVGPPLPKDPQQPAGNARKQKNKKVKEPPLKDAAPSSVPAASDKGSKPTAHICYIFHSLLSYKMKMKIKLLL